MYNNNRGKKINFNHHTHLRICVQAYLPVQTDPLTGHISCRQRCTLGDVETESGPVGKLLNPSNHGPDGSISFCNDCQIISISQTLDFEAFPKGIPFGRT